MRRLLRLLAVIMVASCLISPQARAEVGETDIRDVLPLTATQRAKLARLVKSDAEAGALFAALKSKLPPDRVPRPLAVIHYE